MEEFLTRLEEKQYKKLKEYAYKNNISMAEAVRQALEMFLLNKTNEKKKTYR